MIIAELEEPYKTMAINNQIAQGNPRNESLYVRLPERDGNFDFNSTPEGYTFWDKVANSEDPPYAHLTSYHALGMEPVTPIELSSVSAIELGPVIDVTTDAIYTRAVESLSNDALIELTKKLAQACLKDILEKKASTPSDIEDWPVIEFKYMAAYPEHNVIHVMPVFNWLHANYNSPTTTKK